MNDSDRTQNPYQSPRTITADSQPSVRSVQSDWKLILKRWEVLRFLYNVIVGVAGLPALVMIPVPVLPVAIVGAVMYGFCANVMYLLGPVAELYLNWFVDAWGDQSLPDWVSGFVRSRGLTALLFVAGILFSVGLTLTISLSVAFGAAMHD
jgi:hypothetical protein